MSILYKPVKIETAEQAEALPINTLAISADGVDPAIRKEDGWHGIFGDPPYSHAEMVSDYALVPIKAEEETQGITTWPRPDNAPWPEHSDLCSNSDGEYYYREGDGTAHDITEEMTAWLDAHPVRTRLVTPWEDA